MMIGYYAVVTVEDDAHRAGKSIADENRSPTK
jgi:hypothetical protein